MADETASIRIQILGGIRAAVEASGVAKAIDRLGDKVSDLDRQSLMASKSFNRLRRAMNRVRNSSLTLRLGFVNLTLSMSATTVVSLGLATIGLATLTAALAATAIAVGVVAAAFAAGFIPIIGAAAIGVAGIVDRFKQMNEVVGSAAYKLTDAFYGLRGAFRDATAQGADAVLFAIARAAERLTPLLRGLEPAFTAIGRATGGAIDTLSTRLAGMLPQITDMFTALVPVVQAAGEMAASLAEFLVTAATVGAPLVVSAFQGLSGAMGGWTDSLNQGALDTAIQRIKGFADGVMVFVRALAAPIAPVLGPAIREFSEAWKTLGPNLGTIIGTLIAGLIQVGRVALPVVTAGAQWLAENLPGILRWLGEMGVKLWNAVKPLGPFFENVIWPILKGLGKGIGFTFEAAIGLIGRVARILGWVGEKAEFLKPVFEAIGVVIGGAMGGAATVANTLLDVLKEVKNVIVDVFNFLTDLPGKVGDTVKSLPGKFLRKLTGPTIPGNATGGTITRGGLSWVGERGPELVSLPKMSTVFSASESRAIASGERPQAPAAQPAPTVIHQVLQAVLPDGRVIAEAVKDFNLSQALLEG